MSYAFITFQQQPFPTLAPKSQPFYPICIYYKLPISSSSSSDRVSQTYLIKIVSFNIYRNKNFKLFPQHFERKSWM